MNWVTMATKFYMDKMVVVVERGVVDLERVGLERVGLERAGLERVGLDVVISYVIRGRATDSVNICAWVHMFLYSFIT